LSQRIIGITGGIASGKSTVANYLAQQYHLAIFDADLYAREAIKGQLLVEIFNRYQNRVLVDSQLSNPKILTNLLSQTPSKTPSKIPGKELEENLVEFEHFLDRSKLGQIIFSDRQERQWLEGLIHPIVRDRFITDIKNHSSQSTLVLVIPLLFEVKWQDLVTEIWLVYCHVDQQRQRLVARNNLTVAEAQLRIDSQMPIEQKLKLADLVIDNSFDLRSNHLGNDLIKDSSKDLSNLYAQIDRAIQTD
jgi:dephospho-CoA kinase